MVTWLRNAKTNKKTNIKKKEAQPSTQALLKGFPNAMFFFFCFFVEKPEREELW